MLLKVYSCDIIISKGVWTLLKKSDNSFSTISVMQELSTYLKLSYLIS